MEKDEFVKMAEDTAKEHFNDLRASEMERQMAEAELQRIAFRNAGLRR